MARTAAPPLTRPCNSHLATVQGHTRAYAAPGTWHRPLRLSRARDSPAHAWFQVVRLGLNSGDNALWITLWVADLRHCSPLRFVPRRRRRARHDPLNYALFTTPLPSTTLLDYSHIAVVGVVGGCVGLSGKRRLQGERGEPCGNGMYFLPSRS